MGISLIVVVNVINESTLLNMNYQLKNGISAIIGMTHQRMFVVLRVYQCEWRVAGERERDFSAAGIKY